MDCTANDFAYVLHGRPMHAGVAFSGILCQTAPRTSSHGPHSVMALNADPKKSATTVHVSVITLYGIEKSGVGKFTTAESGPMFMPRGVQRATRRRGTQAGDAAHGTRHQSSAPLLRVRLPPRPSAPSRRPVSPTAPHPVPNTCQADRMADRTAIPCCCAARSTSRGHGAHWRIGIAARCRAARRAAKGLGLRGCGHGPARERAAIAGALLPSVYSRR